MYFINYIYYFMFIIYMPIIFKFPEIIQRPVQDKPLYIMIRSIKRNCLPLLIQGNKTCGSCGHK